ncbi:MAG: polymerase, sigma-24 subunit, subfamily [Acidobacteria bacterium]|nr:polymerase, sigma-24 subunit, subfamily [Acidobacteriota bacterium]
MYEAEATADMLLMTAQSAPAPAHREAPSSPEALLIRAVLAGNRDSFASLYELYAPMVHGILLARVPRTEVEDLVQDIFLHAFKKLATLRDANAFGGWLAMITRNRAMDFHRYARATIEVKEEHAIGDRRKKAKAEEILNVIRSLPDAYRETLVLRLVEGMTGPEIASRTGLTAASVRVNLHRGMKLLRAKLGMQEEAETRA